MKFTGHIYTPRMALCGTNSGQEVNGNKIHEKGGNLPKTLSIIAIFIVDDRFHFHTLVEPHYF